MSRKVEDFINFCVSIPVDISNSKKPPMFPTQALWNDLDSTTVTSIQQAICDLRDNGKLAEIQEQWLGSAIPLTFESDTMNLRARIVGPAPGFIEQDESGNWQGYHLDLVDEIVRQAKNDDVTLTIDIDYDNLLPITDYNAAVEALDVPCTQEECQAPPYDMVIGDFYHSTTRVGWAVASAPWQFARFNSLMLNDGEYESVNDLVAGGGGLCNPIGYSTYSQIRELAGDASNVDCEAYDDCYAKLRDGTCDILYDSDSVNNGAAAANCDFTAVADDAIPDTNYYVYYTSENLDPAVHVGMLKWICDIPEDFLDGLFIKWLKPTDAVCDDDDDGGAVGAIGKLPHLAFAFVLGIAFALLG
jgi:hypothetical protein